MSRVNGGLPVVDVNVRRRGRVCSYEVVRVRFYVLVLGCDGEFATILASRNDHTNMTAPLPVCSAKLSMFGPG